MISDEFDVSKCKQLLMESFPNGYILKNIHEVCLAVGLRMSVQGQNQDGKWLDVPDKIFTAILISPSECEKGHFRIAP